MGTDNALSFGDNTSITLGTLQSLRITGSFTVEMWVNFDATAAATTNSDPFFSMECSAATPPTGVPVRYFISNGMLKRLVGTASASNVASNITSLDADTWYHFAFWWDATTLLPSMCMNFDSYTTVGNVTIPTTITTTYASTTSLVLGKGSATKSFKGMMSEVRVWNGIRRKEELKTDFYRRLTALEPNLLSYLPLDGDTATTALDKKTSTDLTITSGTVWSGFVPLQKATEPQTIASRPNRVVVGEFNGSTSQISVPHAASLAFTTAFTIEAWVRPMATNVTHDRYPVVSKRAGTGATATGWELRVGVSMVSFIAKIGTQQIEVQCTYVSTRALSMASHWMHVIVVFNGTSLILYVHPGPVGYSVSKTVTGQLVDSGGSLTIGRNPTSGDTMDGQIAEVRLWNVARTATQFYTNRFVLSNSTGLVARYRLEGNAKEMLGTATPNPLDGTATNVRWARSGAPLEYSSAEVLALAAATEPDALLNQISTLKNEKKTLENDRDTALADKATALADKATAEAAVAAALEEKTAADRARAKALEEKMAAEAARDAALAEKTAAEAARATALEDKTAADRARGQALEDKAALETAKTNIETQRDKALKDKAAVEAELNKPPPPPRRLPPSEETSSNREPVSSVPIGDFVRSVATAVADAQFKLDRSSVMVAEFMSGFYPLRDTVTGQLINGNGEIATEPVMVDSRVQFGHRFEDGKRVPNWLSMMELGFVPNFYQFVDTVIEVRLALQVEKTGRNVDPTTGKIVDSPGNTQDLKLSTTPVDASYAGGFNYKLDMASVFKTKLVCVPPPAALEDRLRELMRQETIATTAIVVDTPAET